jgi:hypothetical protein
MKVLAVSLGIALCLASTAATVAADGRRGQVRGDFRGSQNFGRHHHHGFGRHHHHGFVDRPFFSPFVGSSVVVVSPVVVAPAPVYSAPPFVSAPAVYGWGGAGAYATPPPPPQLPRVVEFPTGRYELRGDGTYTPYAWVWIPNPPLAPPAPAPPAAAPAPFASAAEPIASRPAATTPLYRWTNEQGVTTWTDNLEKIPAKSRGQASRLTP